MITDKFITVVEMQEIINVCQRLDALRVLFDSDRATSVDLLTDETGEYRTFAVYDSNGELVGHIGYAFDTYALYLDNGEEVEDEPDEPSYVEIDNSNRATVPAGQDCPKCGKRSYGAHLPDVSMNCWRPK